LEFGLVRAERCCLAAVELVWLAGFLPSFSGIGLRELVRYTPSCGSRYTRDLGSLEDLGGCFVLLDAHLSCFYRSIYSISATGESRAISGRPKKKKNSFLPQPASPSNPKQQHVIPKNRRLGRVYAIRPNVPEHQLNVSFTRDGLRYISIVPQGPSQQNMPMPTSPIRVQRAEKIREFHHHMACLGYLSLTNRFYDFRIYCF
jgi:hypothetical protein